MAESAGTVRYERFGFEEQGPARGDLALTADEVRRLTLYSQGFLGAAAKRGGVTGVLRRVGAVQLDTISVLARSHELVAYARLGPVGRAAVEAAYWPSPRGGLSPSVGGSRPPSPLASPIPPGWPPGRPKTFEYWAHAACILPIEDWPYYAWRRRAIAAKGQRWHQVSERTCDEVLARLRDEGPLTATQLGGAKAGGPWWDWSEVKIAAEWLLDTGRAVCVRRVGWRRIYDLPERAVPAELLAQDPTDAECLAYLVRATARALGVVTQADLIEYQRFNGQGLHIRGGAALDEAAEAAGLTPVTVPGGKRPLAAWADPAALGWLSAGGRGTHRTTLLSPFDSLIWDRKRTRRMFGYHHLFEPYVPKEKRERGYFTMPLLAGGQILGWVDPAREGSTLVARNLLLEKPAAVAPMARALAEAAQWVGCANVRVERTSPTLYAQPLLDALQALGVS
ncbi:MAG TPA: crosslink repair DNA glycosylase YcaQ family protein [Trebonia sp.]|nr:crosslink repair DNA glycosylase YcaQ family protein [Trebonia sp.]